MSSIYSIAKYLWNNGLSDWLWLTSSIAAGVLVARCIIAVMA